MCSRGDRSVQTRESIFDDEFGRDGSDQHRGDQQRSDQLRGDQQRSDQQRGDQQRSDPDARGRGGTAVPVLRGTGRARSSRAGRTGGRPRAPSTLRTRPGRWRPPTAPRCRRTSSTCWTCSRTRPARACTSGTRWATSAPTCIGRYMRMTGRNVLHTIGYDAFGLPAEQYAVRTGTHPRDDHRGKHRPVPRAAAQAGFRPRPAPQRRDHGPGVLPLDAVDLHPAVRGLVRPGRSSVPGRSARWSRSSTAGTRATPDGRPWGELTRTEQQQVLAGYRLAYIDFAPVNWCPGLGTVLSNEEVTPEGRSAIGNYPGVPPQPAAVDDADHRLRRPAARRPGPAGLARVGEGHAAQLDRPFRTAPG